MYVGEGSGLGPDVACSSEVWEWLWWVAYVTVVWTCLGTIEFEVEVTVVEAPEDSGPEWARYLMYTCPGTNISKSHKECLELGAASGG